MARRLANPTTPASQSSQSVQARIGLDEADKEEWRRLYKSEPPKISRDLLAMGIAYRREEIEHGGLGKATLRKLQTLAKSLQGHRPGRTCTGTCFKARRAADPQMAWPNAHRDRNQGVDSSMEESVIHPSP